MRIRLKTNIHGAWKGVKGSEVDRPDSEARKLIAAGFAVQIVPATIIETATLTEQLETPEK
jgi:hypothetical protein